ncbi:MAG: DNA recombination protein RmuC [Candidatus Marinimicrobia bacterium]|nr:DNA recombination protein RmuC [Candidatus Neomarinimicrobiota bacterium]
MDGLIVVLLGLLTVGVGTLAFVLWRRGPRQALCARLEWQVREFDTQRAGFEQQARELEALKDAYARLEERAALERRQADEKAALLETAEKRLQTAFENLAQRIFSEQGRTLNTEHRERLTAVLTPFKEQLDAFRRRVDEVQRDEGARAAQLLEQVRQLQASSNQVSADANRLATAIRGEAKRQGDWGELIVERILEASGLEAGRDYETQNSLVSESGARQRPDFILYLPGNKAVILDAKVSLTAYDRWVNAADEAAAAQARTEHLKSVRQHVAELQAKDYSRLLGNRSLDFVIMCIPIEPAFQAALQADPDLLTDLARAPVVLTGPATLMITLKLIAQIWRREYENRNAERIAERAGLLYDQVTLVVQSLGDAQRRLTQTTASVDEALKRLQTGRGNLVGRVEELRRLGAKVSKQLPDEICQDALAADEQAATPAD